MPKIQFLANQNTLHIQEFRAKLGSNAYVEGHVMSDLQVYCSHSCWGKDTRICEPIRLGDSICLYGSIQYSFYTQQFRLKKNCWDLIVGVKVDSSWHT